MEPSPTLSSSTIPSLAVRATDMLNEERERHPVAVPSPHCHCPFVRIRSAFSSGGLFVPGEGASSAESSPSSLGPLGNTREPCPARSPLLAWTRPPVCPQRQNIPWARLTLEVSCLSTYFRRHFALFQSPFPPLFILRLPGTVPARAALVR